MLFCVEHDSFPLGVIALMLTQLSLHFFPSAFALLGITLQLATIIQPNIFARYSKKSEETPLAGIRARVVTLLDSFGLTQANREKLFAILNDIQNKKVCSKEDAKHVAALEKIGTSR